MLSISYLVWFYFTTMGDSYGIHFFSVYLSSFSFFEEEQHVGNFFLSPSDKDKIPRASVERKKAGWEWVHYLCQNHHLHIFS